MNELTTKSKTLANRLFQIAFNTQYYIDKNYEKDSIMEYYFRQAKINHFNLPNENNDSQQDERCNINNFGRLILAFFEYLYNLFKVK